MTSQILLRQAVAMHQAGNLGAAERLYVQVLAVNRTNYQAQYMLACLFYQQQRQPEALRAAEAALKLSPNAKEALALYSVLLTSAGQHDKALAVISKVVAREPRDAEAWHNRGVILAELNRLEEAVASYDKALALRPSAEAWINRGAALLGSGRPEEALSSFDEALSLKPDLASALYFRGNALVELEQYIEAVAAFDAMLAQAPNSCEAWSNRGLALHKTKNYVGALESYDKAVELRPDYAPAWINRGKALYSCERFEEALESYDKALSIEPDNLDALYFRADTMRSLHAFDDALTCLDKALEIKTDFFPAQFLRGWLLIELNRISDGLEIISRAAEGDIGSRSEPMASHPPHKADHDAEQLAYLAELGQKVDEAKPYFAGGERLPISAVNPENTELATSQWEKSRPRVAVIDNLLSPEALEGLRRFCWGSTVWRTSYDDGYLGAMAEHGFSCPLLAQIAEELRDTFPAIIGDHRLRMLWGFKYDSRLKGINIHADQAAVNVNFWITPDDANLNDEGGGLVIWDVAAPQDWDPDQYNGDEAAVRAFLERSSSKPIKVPYRANRAVIFDSDLFHETDVIDFKEGYLNRRINITMLYGRRTYYGK